MNNWSRFSHWRISTTSTHRQMRSAGKRWAMWFISAHCWSSPNHCKRLCTYCGLNATDQKLSRFRMDPRDMIATAQEAARAGYRTIVLQSGEDPWYTPDRIGDIVKQIKKNRHGHHTELWGVSGRRLPVLGGTAARTVICLNTKHPTQRSMPPCTPIAPWTRAWRACER